MVYRVLVLFFLVSSGLLHVLCQDLGQDPPVARTEQLGEIFGYTLKSDGGYDFYAFSGIPYAQPPIEDLRFEPPKPFRGNFSHFNATKECSICIQEDYIPRPTEPEGSEDCLCLNVYTRKVPKPGQSHPKLDVLFVIHGGSYVFLSGDKENFVPDIMMDKEIVLVTINYRLGMFGFFSTGDSACPGNMGLKDQTMALRWVKDNIYNFGGNPDSVTILGESVGAVSVNHHILSQLSKGLFHKAISESGVSTIFWSLEFKPSEIQRKKKLLASLMKCPDSPSEDLMACLKKQKAMDIVTKNPAFLRWEYYPNEVIRPVVEGNEKGAFLPDYPVPIIQSGKYNKVPWLVGYNKDEGAYLAADLMTREAMFSQLQKDPNKVLEHVLDYDLLDKSKRDKTSKAIRTFYFGDATRAIGRDDDKNVTMMITDRHFLAETYNCVVGIAKYSPVYFYRLSYQSNYSYAKFFANTTENFGVSHVDELIYTFRTDMFPKMEEGQPEKNVSEIIVDLWVNFMKTGNPTPEDKKWTKVDPNNVKYMDINLPSPKMMEFDAKERVDLWNSLQPIN